MENYTQLVPEISHNVHNGHEMQTTYESHSMILAILTELRELKQIVKTKNEENKNTIKTLTNEIVELRDEVRQLKIPPLQELDTSMLPPLPFTDFDEFKDFDTILVLEDDLRTQLKIVLQRVGGKDFPSFLRAALKSIICDELAVNICWRGTTEKPSIKEFTCFKLIKDVCHMKYAHTTDNEINRIVQQHFLHATDRIKKRPKAVK